MKQCKRKERKEVWGTAAVLKCFVFLFRFMIFAQMREPFIHKENKLRARTACLSEMGIIQFPITLIAMKMKAPGQTPGHYQCCGGVGCLNLTWVQTLGQVLDAHCLSLTCTEQNRLPLPGYLCLKRCQWSPVFSVNDSLLQKISRDLFPAWGPARHGTLLLREGREETR